jgi:MFS transporter, DHA1 family, multidrug resistance protein
MFDNMGIQWAGTLLGCIALALVPIPVYFLFSGARLRQKSQFSPILRIKGASNHNIHTEDIQDTRTGEEDH